MKKNFVFAIMCLLTGVGVSAKDGDRFEWRPYDNKDISAALLFEVVSDVEKTLQVVEIYPPSPDTPIDWILTPSGWPQELPEEYKGYKIIQICDKAFFNMDYGRDLYCIDIADISHIGDYAFWGSCRRDPWGYGLEQITMEKVESIGEYAFANSKITRIWLFCDTPPSAYMNSFSEWTFENCNVYVPYLSWSLYINHPVWGRFRGLDLGVDDIEIEDVYFRVLGNEIIVSGAPDGSIISVYDMTGRCINTIAYNQESDNAITTPGGGIYILQCAGKTYKIKVQP